MKCQPDERQAFEKYVIDVINLSIKPLSQKNNNWAFCKYCFGKDKSNIEIILKENSIAYKLIDLSDDKCKVLYLLNLYNISLSNVEDLLEPYLINIDEIPIEEREDFTSRSHPKKDYKLFNISELKLSYFIIDKSDLNTVEIILLNKLGIEFEYFTIDEKNDKYFVDGLCYFKVEDYYPVEDEYMSYKILCELKRSNIPFCEIYDREGEFSIRCEIDVNGKHKYSYREDLNCAFRSSWEANIARVLNYLNLFWEYEKSSFERLDCNGNHIGYYFPDFFLKDKTIIEVKGFWDQDSLSKAKEFVSNYKEFKYYFIDHDIYYNLKRKYMSIIPNWEADTCDSITTESVKVVGVSFGERKKLFLLLKRAMRCF